MLIQRFNKKQIIIVSLIIFLILSWQIFILTTGFKGIYPHEPILFALISESKTLLYKVYLSYGSGFFIVLILFFMLNKKEKKSLYGDARFAYLWEFKKLFGTEKQGFFLGFLNGTRLIVKDICHFLIIAETRAGKGVSWILPMFFTWHGSIIALDIKRELYKYSAGFRKMIGSEVYIVDVMNEDKETHSVNVFDYIPDNKAMRISFIQKVAEFLTPTPPGAEPIWTGSARELFSGICLLIDDIPGAKLSMGEVFRTLHPKTPINEYLSDLLEEHEDILDPVCKMYLWSFVNTADRTRSSILKQLTSVLGIYANPIVDAATATSSFDFRDVKKKKMTIYIRTPEKYLKACGPVINMIFQFAVDMNLDKIIDEDPEYKHPCAFLMDEFSALGPMPVFSEKIEFVLGYGLCFVLVTQSMEKLAEDYTTRLANHMAKNCRIKGYLKPNEQSDAELISRRLNYTTVKHTSEKSKDWLDILPDHQKESKASRALMLPDEVLHMPDEKCILIIKGLHPIYADRIYHYNDKKLSKYHKLTPPKIPVIKLKLHEMKESNIDTMIVDLSATIPDTTDTILSDEAVIEAGKQYLDQIGVKY